VGGHQAAPQPVPRRRPGAGRQIGRRPHAESDIPTNPPPARFDPNLTSQPCRPAAQPTLVLTPVTHPHKTPNHACSQMCTPDRFVDGLCADRRLYVHAVCRAGHHLKRKALEKLGLWFVHVNPDNTTDVRVWGVEGGRLPCGGAAWALEYSR
jgi:hypothetical protein